MINTILHMYLDLQMMVLLHKDNRHEKSYVYSICICMFIVTKYRSGIVMDIVSFGGIKFMQFLMTTIQNCMKNLILA